MKNFKRQEIKIEKGIPITLKNGVMMYPFDKLEVGDSFVIPNKKTNQLGSLIQLAKNRLQRKFVTRTIEGGTRIWRTE